MKVLAYTSLAVVALLAPTSFALAAAVPWAQGGGGQQAADQPAAAVDLEAKLGKAAYKRLVAPIQAKLKLAETALAAHNKEMQKPVDKRNPRLLLACKERAATAYLGASLAAKMAANRQRDPAVKQAILETFQKPNQQKAIDIFLELASKAQEANNTRMAVAFYKRILQIDKENAQAKEALTQIAKRLQQEAASGRRTSGSKGGGTSYERRSWERDDDYSGTKGKHYDDHRGGW